MNFENIVVEQAIFEVRYENGYLYWDNFGKLWLALTKKFPDFKRVAVGPKEARLRWQEKGIEVVFDPDKTSIQQHAPQKYDDICNLSDALVEIVNKYMEIEVFNRVGNRFIGFLPCETEEDAVKAVLGTQLISLNEEKTKYLGEDLKEIQIRMIHHKSDVGCMLQLTSVKRELPKVFPGELRMPWFKEISMMIDVDYFSTKVVDFGILHGGELINANLHRLKLLIKTL